MHRRLVVKSLVAVTSGVLRPSLWRTSGDPPQAADVNQVRRVLVMFKCHFDAGFIDTQTNVVNKYFKQYFPGAIEVAETMRSSGEDRYTWTTGSWLLYEYLEQATPAERRRMEAAIQRGDIAWHALPFSWQTEMLDQSMIAGGLSLSQALDRRFGLTTIGAKMTDVPGHTRALIAPLYEHGVTFLDIGVNGGSTPADAPPLFLWKNAKGQSLTVMYHSGYGSVVHVPRSDLAIAIEVRDDNSGPHDPKEIAAIYQRLRQTYPNATITAANLSDIATAVAPSRAALPVVTQEIGDTWIHGVGSDPLKVARYREVARLRRSWIDQGRFQCGDAVDLALLRHALLEVEHTWGTDTKTWLDFTNYKPADLARMLDTKNYKVVEFSWQEKRQDLLNGIETLPAAMRLEAKDTLAGLAAKQPRLSSAATPHPLAESIDTRYFSLAFDPRTGAIVQLLNKKTKKNWASTQRPLALFTYQTLSQSDYDHFFAEYIISKEDWVPKDFGKPNMANYGAKSRDWTPSLSALQIDRTPSGVNLLATLAIASDSALETGVAAFPRTLYMQLWLPNAEPAIHMDFTWMGKSATRLPEAMWLTFDPLMSDKARWNLVISDETVDPLDVISAGNRHMHAVSSFSCKDGGNVFAVETMDAPLLSLGARSPLAFSRAQPDLSSGVHCNLFNNTWGTNYVMWFSEDMRFRFVLKA